MSRQTGATVALSENKMMSAEHIEDEKVYHRVLYWKAAFNGNLEDMEKYKYPIKIAQSGSISKYCEYCMSSTCAHSIFLSDDIPYNAFHTLWECVLSSIYNVKTIIQCSIKIRHHVASYKYHPYVHDSNGFYPSLERFYPLPLDAMEEAFKDMWLPRNEFWRSLKTPLTNISHKLPYLIKTKQLLEKYKLLLSVNNKMDKIKNRIKKLNKIIQPCISMKINLYIMVRANLLCIDIADYIETFIGNF